MKNIYLSSITSKLFAFSFLFVFINVFSASAQTAKPDFTGTWTLNEAKSQLGEGPGRRAAKQMIITQKADSLTNERTIARQSGETIVSKEKYSLDGSESDNSIDGRKKKSIATWSNTLQELTVNSTTVFDRDGNTMQMKSTEVYKLNSGQTLTVETTFSSTRGDFKTTLVYDLQK